MNVSQPCISDALLSRLFPYFTDVAQQLHHSSRSIDCLLRCANAVSYAYIGLLGFLFLFCSCCFCTKCAWGVHISSHVHRRDIRNHDHEHTVLTAWLRLVSPSGSCCIFIVRCFFVPCERLAAVNLLFLVLSWCSHLTSSLYRRPAALAVNMVMQQPLVWTHTFVFILHLHLDDEQVPSPGVSMYRC